MPAMKAPLLVSVPVALPSRKGCHPDLETIMPLLSLCMPSNRDLKGSLAAIGEALAFAEARDAQLLISDNSGDPAKEAYWRGRSPRIRYATASRTTAFQNFLAVLQMAETPYILHLGDDDGIGIDPSCPAYDLSALPADYMGVRPRTELFVPAIGVIRTKEFAIEGITPAERMREYFRKSGNDNCGFYSIYRREPYLNLIRLFAEQHPIKGDFVDWALAFTLFAYGRMAYDPSVIYRYNFEQWATAARIEAKNRQMFAAAGLPDHTEMYQPLLMALDLFVFLARPGTPLTREQSLEAVGLVAGDILNAFINQVIRKPEDYSEKMRYLVELAGQEDNAFGRLQLAMIMVDELKPGLKDAYVAYYQMAQQFR